MSPADALADLVKRRRRDMVHYATAYVRDPHAAEDVVQDALLRAARKLPSAEDVDRYGGLDRWVFRIITHTVIDRSRKNYVKREVPVERVDDAPDMFNVEREVIVEELRAEILAAIETINARFRPALRGLLVDKSYRQIAAEIGMTEGSVRPNIMRGRAALRDALGR